MTPQEKGQWEEMVQKKASELAEHFDSVQLFVTGHRGGEETTFSYEYGKGNFYARMGQINEWMTIQTPYAVQHAIRKDAQAQE
jgi:uncharacterized alpha/beta hydrolase family protein